VFLREACILRVLADKADGSWWRKKSSEKQKGWKDDVRGWSKRVWYTFCIQTPSSQTPSGGHGSWMISNRTAWVQEPDRDSIGKAWLKTVVKIDLTSSTTYPSNRFMSQTNKDTGGLVREKSDTGGLVKEKSEGEWEISGHFLSYIAFPHCFECWIWLEDDYQARYPMSIS
jgi:hypothetical protein